jgi:hypothetical protein
MRQIGGFLWVLRFPPPIKLTVMILLKYCYKLLISFYIYFLYYKLAKKDSLPSVENNVENAQVIDSGLDVVNYVHVVMYNGKLYMEFIVYTVIGLGGNGV